MVRHLLRAFVVVLALAAASAYTAAALGTIQGKVPPDRVEAALQDQAQRFAARHFAYTEPPRADAPLFMPGFPALVAGLIGVDVPRLELIRSLALTAILFTAILLLCLVHFETASWTLALAAAGAYLFGQGLFATQPGVARPESIMFLLVLLAFGALRYFVGVAGSIIAGVLLALAWFVDAGALLFIVGALVSQALDERRRLAILAITTGILLAAVSLVLAPRLGPWFGAAAWSGPLAFAFHPRAAVMFASVTLLGKLGLFSLVAILSCALSNSPWRDREGLWVWLGVSAVCAGAFATQRIGAGGAAVLGASVAALVLIGTLALQRVVHQLAERSGREGPSGEAVMMTALVIQFAVFASTAIDAAWVRALTFGG